MPPHCFQNVQSLFSRNIFHFCLISVSIRFKHRQNAPHEYTLLAFMFTLQFSNRFKYRQNAPFTILFLFSFLCSSKSFQILSECTLKRPFFKNVLIGSNSVRTHALETLFSKLSLKLQIVSNSVKLHALET